ncbi:MAG: hypothetical protein RSE12_08885 [Fuscovulum sp.]|nr:MAG: hypothetical protein RSE12_08885 [Fuscovulum sp.]
MSLKQRLAKLEAVSGDPVEPLSEGVLRQLETLADGMAALGWDRAEALEALVYFQRHNGKPVDDAPITGADARAIGRLEADPELRELVFVKAVIEWRNFPLNCTAQEAAGIIGGLRDMLEGEDA